MRSQKRLLVTMELVREKKPLESVRKADLLVVITNLLHPFIFLIGPPNGALS